METDVDKKFKCHVCQLEENYDYFGAEPPFAKHIIYNEKCYIMKDPFSPLNKGEVLVLGGICNFCNLQACSRCSLFYSKRICISCCNNIKQDLPSVLQGKINKLSKNMQQ